MKSLNAKDAVLRAMPREHFDAWQGEELKDCGDDEANTRMPPLLAKGLATAPAKLKVPELKKPLKDQMAGARDQAS